MREAGEMDRLRTADCIVIKPKTTKITTTLYDLLVGINAKILSPQDSSKESIQGDKVDLAALTVKQMFETGQIKFMNSQTIKGYFTEINIIKDI
jgi:hypothetical protein